MTKLFLSHSSKDKPAVRQLAAELRRRNIEVWLDEWEIDVGDSITQKVQEGLSGADFVAVWLTENSVKSGWVTKEWQSKIFGEISSTRTTVLPLLAEDCEIPFFLSDKMYADFRGPFQEGIRHLARSLKHKGAIVVESVGEAESHSVAERTKAFLDDLSEAQIPFPTVGNLKIVRSLKQLPRSGKLLRLETMTPKIPIRSIFNHVNSVAHSADVLMPHLDCELSGVELIDLARVIAYHDVCEVVIGDTPQYTTLNRSKRSRARVSAEIRLSQLPNGEPERITNRFIAMYLQDSERHSLIKTMEIMSSDVSVRRVAYALDKIDPILGVWRYLKYLRNIKSFPIDEFMSRMRHFFENPHVRVTIANTRETRSLVSLVDQLQDPSIALSYFKDHRILDSDLFALPSDTVLRLVEGHELEFVPQRRVNAISKNRH